MARIIRLVGRSEADRVVELDRGINHRGLKNVCGRTFADVGPRKDKTPIMAYRRWVARHANGRTREWILVGGRA